MELAIIGAGGHGRELAAIARAQHGSDISVTFWDDAIAVGEHDFGTVAGRIDELSSDKASHFLIGIGEPQTRVSMSQRYELTGIAAATAIHPTATVGERCSVGPGAVIGAGSVITCDTTVGQHTHIHSNVVISHDCSIADFVVITPGVVIAGDVEVHDLAWVGAGATVNRGMTIGRSAIVGAGAVVINPVDPGDTVAGTPARSLNPKSQR